MIRAVDRSGPPRRSPGGASLRKIITRDSRAQRAGGDGGCDTMMDGPKGTSMAITLRPAKPVTDDELLELSRQNPGYQFERTAKGELVVTPMGGQSSHREHEISLQLGIWTKRDGRGIAFSPSGGFRLS